MALRTIVWCAVSTKPQADEDEKFSLSEQERDGLAWCEKNDAKVVDILRVPGHSRSYRSLEQLAADARASNPPIDAFDKLIEHFDRMDFDVLWCRDADRFARKASLLHLIVETIIEDCSARIYSSVDGWVDESNADIFAMVKGYTTSQEIKKLVKYRDLGMKKRAERGIRLNTIPFAFKAVVNEKGEDIGIAPDRDVQHIVDDAVMLLLEGQGWHDFEKIMFERFGHGKNHQPYGGHYFRRLFYHPVFYGHSVWRLTAKGKKRYHRGNTGCWMFDLTELPPAGVVLFPNTHEPYYTGYKADFIQAELRRRRGIKGTMSPSETRPFSGLLVCAACAFNLTIQRNGQGNFYYTCRTRFRYRSGWTTRDCPKQKSISVQKVQQFLSPLLEDAIRTGDPAFILDMSSDKSDSSAINQLERDIRNLEVEARVLIRKQVPEALRELHEEELTAVGEELNVKKARLTTLERQRMLREGASSGQHAALAKLQTYESVAAFWEEPGRVVNQVLHALFGDYRMWVLDGEIIRISLAPPRTKSKRANGDR